jgi:hypothetical protein
LFRKTFGFDEKQLPLFAFMAGSPFSLKNFMPTLGHFDILWLRWRSALLLIPCAVDCLRAARYPVLGRPHSD